MKSKLELMLEKRIAKLEEEIEMDPSIADEQLRGELEDDLNAFIKQCTAKFNEKIGNFNSDKALKKTKSFKIIKALKDAWLTSAKR